LCKQILWKNSSLQQSLLCGLPQSRLCCIRSILPLAGSLNFSKGLQEARSLGSSLPSGIPVFLTKDRIFLVCLKNTSTSWFYISGVKRKEFHMSQEKTKQKTRKEVSNMIEVARIFKVENKEESTLKAFVDVKVSDVVLIKGIRVLAKKEGGLFAAMPSNLAGDGKYYPTVKFLTAEANEELQKVVLAAYEA